MSKETEAEYWARPRADLDGLDERFPVRPVANNAFDGRRLARYIAGATDRVQKFPAYERSVALQNLARFCRVPKDQV